VEPQPSAHAIRNDGEEVGRRIELKKCWLNPKGELKKKRNNSDSFLFNF
jgi:hypothetical protein